MPTTSVKKTIAAMTDRKAAIAKIHAYKATGHSLSRSGNLVM
jgi:hypothetical protein